METELIKALITPEHWTAFQAGMKSGDRCGQAFFNTCPLEWREKLRGSTVDPFYRTSYRDVVNALDYLTR